MLLAYERDLAAAGVEEEPLRTRVSSSRWQQVRTFGATLDQQGLPDRFEVMWYRTEVDVDMSPSRQYWLHFSAVDGISSLWINGEPVEAPGEAEAGPAEIATFPALSPFTVDVTDLLRDGQNRIAIRVDHRVLRELSLGGIAQPIYLLTQEHR